MTEEWRPIEGYEGVYEVSDAGRIRSLPRTGRDRNGKTYRLKGRVFKAGPAVNGYRLVSLCASGAQRSYYVHQLVATAFHGPRPDGMEVCHNDGDPLNNAASNLRWGTRSDNVQDALTHGTHWLARRTSCKRGHEFTPENTYHHPKGGRTCRACTNMHSVAYRAKKQAAA